MDQYKDLQKALTVKFQDDRLLQLALTHSSHLNETQIDDPLSNMRLAFLGDAILGMIVAETLYTQSRQLSTDQ